MRGIHERTLIDLNKRMDKDGEGIILPDSRFLSFTLTSRISSKLGEVGLVVTEIKDGEVTRFRSGPTSDDLTVLDQYLREEPIRKRHWFRLDLQ